MISRTKPFLANEKVLLPVPTWSILVVSIDVSGINEKGSDWIRLVFAHMFPLNSGAPFASANFISDGNVQVSPYLAMHTHNGACPTNGGSVIQGYNPIAFPVRPFNIGIYHISFIPETSNIPQSKLPSTHRQLVSKSSYPDKCVLSSADKHS